MISFATPLALLLAIPLIGLAIAFWRNSFANLTRRRSQVALAVRLVMLSVIILGLAGAGLDLGQSREASVIVADLSASDAQAASQMQAFINQAARRRPADARLGVVDVGGNARVEQPVSALSGFDGFQTQIDPNYTNLENGILLANAIFPGGYRRRITLLTDAQQNAGDAAGTARLVRSLGVRVDVAPVHLAAGPEVMVDSVNMPSQLRAKERFTVTVTVHSTVATTMILTLYRDNSLVMSRREKARAGENQYSFAEPPLAPGFHSFDARIDPALDTEPENNSGAAFAVVAGPPRVLVVDPSKAEASNVLASLRTTGIHITFQYPFAVIPSLSYLEHFAAVVLIDTPAVALDPLLLHDFVPYVRDLGRGLVVIGGRNAFGMGSYGGTGLETALPVNMNLPKRRELPSAAVVLIIEDLEEGTSVNISKEAGKSVVDLLSERDQVAVNDSLGGVFPVPLQYVRDKPAIDRAIDNMQPGDPMSYKQDLQAAFNRLKGAHATVKHIILLGDGDATDSYETLAKRIRAAGITISTVATNGAGYSDPQTMQTIALWGGGHYYNANDPSNIPKIFLREARAIARSGIVEGRFYPEEVSANPMLRDVRGVTDLTGYVATTPKPTGEMVLVSKKLDPVLAAWQFGLGRSVAWTSDAAGMWTRDWLRAPGGNRFWANLVDWTLPAANGGQLFVSTGSSQGQGTVSVDAAGSVGTNPTVTAKILGPNLHSTVAELQPTAPGHFQGSFAANSPGAYFVSVVARGAGHAAVGEAGLDMPYSAEYRTTGADISFAKQLAQAGGGSVVTQPGAVWSNNLAPVSSRQSLSLWLWLLALLLLPVDIGIRRLVVTRRDLEVISRALGLVRRKVPVSAPALAPLDSIRRRRGEGTAEGTGRRRKPQPASPALASGAVVTASNFSAPRAAKTAASPSASGAAASPSAETGGATTAGRLLASKRRRR